MGIIVSILFAMFVIAVIILSYFIRTLDKVLEGSKDTEDEYIRCPMNSSLHGVGPNRVPDDGCKCEYSTQKWNDNMDRCGGV